MENKIDTLLFDMGNVLLPFDWEIAVTGFAEALQRDPAEIRGALTDPDYSIFFYEFSTGRISTTRFAKQLNQFLHSEMDLDTIQRIWCSIFVEDHPMISLMKNLSRTYRTFILSDTDCLHWEYLNTRYHLEEMVKGAILSFRRGAIKTDAHCFEKILADYKFNPAKTLLIDDLKKNIAGAEKAGLGGILHTSHPSTLEKLKTFGVAPTI